MSYDLMVFNPNAPHTDREGFLAWYDQQTQWSEGHSYDNPDVSTTELRAWFMDMIQQYPAMNGPYAADDPDDPKMSDYSVGKSMIYVAFAWSEQEDAYRQVRSLAEQHGLGFFEVSSKDGAVWMPSDEGQYICIHSGGNT